MRQKKHISVDQLASYEGHTGSVFAMTIDDEERFLYTSGDDGIVAQWDLTEKQPDATALLRSDRAIYSLAVSNQHQQLLAGSSDGTLYVYDLANKVLLQTYRKTPEAIYHMMVQGDLLWICQGKGFLTAIHLQNGEERFFGRLCSEHLRIMIPGLQPDTAFIGASDNHIYHISLPKGDVIRKWEAHDNSVFSLLIHPDGKYLLSGSRDAHFHVWDMQDGFKLIKKVPAHNYTLNYLALSPVGHYFVSASRDNTIKLWDAYDFSLLKVIDFLRNQGHRHSVNKIVWLRKDESLISCGDDRKVFRWKFNVQKD